MKTTSGSTTESKVYVHPHVTPSNSSSSNMLTSTEIRRFLILCHSIHSRPSNKVLLYRRLHLDYHASRQCENRAGGILVSASVSFGVPVQKPSCEALALAANMLYSKEVADVERSWYFWIETEGLRPSRQMLRMSTRLRADVHSRTWNEIFAADRDGSSFKSVHHLPKQLPFAISYEPCVQGYPGPSVEEPRPACATTMSHRFCP